MDDGLGCMIWIGQCIQGGGGMKDFSFTGVLWRMGFALALVFVTFNPSGHSYLHWVLGDLQAGRPAKAIVGLALLCA
jgi:hypothetical protein